MLRLPSISKIPRVDSPHNPGDLFALKIGRNYAPFFLIAKHVNRGTITYQPLVAATTKTGLIPTHNIYKHVHPITKKYPTVEATGEFRMNVLGLPATAEPWEWGKSLKL